MADGDKQYVRLPDGSYLELPGDMKDEDVNAVLKKNAGQFGLPKQQEQPGMLERAARGFVRGATAIGRAIPPQAEPPAPTTERPRETMGAQPGFWEKVRRTATGESPYAYERTMHPERAAEDFGGFTRGIENYTPEGRAEHPFLSRLGDVTRAAKEWSRIPVEMSPLIPGIGWRAGGEAPAGTLPKARPKEVDALAQKVVTAPPPQRPPIGSAEEDLDVAARRMFPGRTYEQLSQEQKQEVMRSYGGGAEPPAERRRTVGQPPVAERRAAPRGTLGGERLHDVANIIEGAFNEPQPAAGPAPYTIGEAMGIRWAKTPGLPDISIPRNMPEGDISGYVAEKQALQRQGVAALPRTPSAPTPTTTATATPAPPAAAPAPSGEAMPTTRPPARPAPTTIGGGATMGQLPTEQQLAEEARRGQMPKVTPPKEVP